MQDKQKTVTAANARKTAKIFYYGNLLAVLIPFPVFILWFGAGILVYALFRHHPNSRVGLLYANCRLPILRFGRWVSSCVDVCAG